MIVVLALVVDAVLGEPRWLWHRVPHPAVVMGRAIGWLDASFNRDMDKPPARRLKGMVSIAGLALAALLVGQILTIGLGFLPLTILFEALFVVALVAGRSLHDHVAAVAAGLERGGLEGGRAAVAHIVGRDPQTLDEPAVARAAIESAAENFCDGVVAPVFWFMVLGLPGIIAYKAINTADSMIGHLRPRHRDFGMPAARLDDAVNWIPARLSAALIAVGALCSRENAEQAAQAAIEDAPAHRSVNAGWPEAAMAGALGLALAGQRTYEGGVLDDAWMNRAGRRRARVTDIHRALKVLLWASLIHCGAYALLAIAF